MKTRKILALTLAAAALLTTASCNLFPGSSNGNGNGNENRNNSQGANGNAKTELTTEGATVSENTVYFEATLIDLYTPKEGESMYVQGTTTTADGVYILTSITNNKAMTEFYDSIAKREWTPEVEEEHNKMQRLHNRVELFFLNGDGQVQRSINLNEGLPEYIMRVGNIQSSADGGLFITATGPYDSQEGIEPMYILRLNADGKYEGEPTELIPHKENSSDNKYYQTVTLSNDGYIFASGSTYSETSYGNIIDVFDPDGEFLFTLQDDTQSEKGWSFNQNLFADNDIIYTTITSYEDWTSYLVPIDVVGKKLGEKIKMGVEPYGASFRDGVIYSSSTHGLQSFDIKTMKSSNLFLWKDQDAEITAGSARAVVLSEDSVFAVSDVYSRNEYRTEFYMLKRAESNPNAGKKIIQIGGFGIDDALSEVIRNFNKNNKEYRAEVLDYYELEDIKNIPEDEYEQKRKAINMMILSGDIPDILIGNYWSCNFPLYASKDLFADLNEYMDKDPEFNKSDYTDLIFTLPAMGDKLFYTFTSYNIRGILTKKETLEGKDGWTLDELAALCDTASSSRNVMAKESYSSMLYYFMTPSLSYLVDSVNHTANFNSDSFKKILTFCKNYGVSDKEMEAEYRSMEESGMWRSPVENIRDGTTLISVTDGYLYSVDSWKQNWNYAGGGLTLTGFPTEESSTLLCSAGNYVAISKSRGNQDIAWELVKALFSTTSAYAWDLPISNSAMEKLIQEQMAPITDPYMLEYPEYAPLTQEGADEFRNILANVSGLEDYDATIMEIIEEESKAFFEGQKSVEDTVRIIQDRVTTHLNQM